MIVCNHSVYQNAKKMTLCAKYLYTKWIWMKMLCRYTCFAYLKLVYPREKIFSHLFIFCGDMRFNKKSCYLVNIEWSRHFMNPYMFCLDFVYFFNGKLIFSVPKWVNLQNRIKQFNCMMTKNYLIANLMKSME